MRRLHRPKLDEEFVNIADFLGQCRARRRARGAIEQVVILLEDRAAAARVVDDGIDLIELRGEGGGVGRGGGGAAATAAWEQGPAASVERRASNERASSAARR